MANNKVGMIAKKTLGEMVKAMTPEECMKIMPEAMKMMGGKTPQMKKMMGEGMVKGA